MVGSRILNGGSEAARVCSGTARAELLGGAQGAEGVRVWGHGSGRVRAKCETGVCDFLQKLCEGRTPREISVTSPPEQKMVTPPT